MALSWSEMQECEDEALAERERIDAEEFDLLYLTQAFLHEQASRDDARFAAMIERVAWGREPF